MPRPARTQAIERAKNSFAALSHTAATVKHTQFYAAMRDIAASIDIVISSLETYPDFQEIKELVRLCREMRSYSWFEQKILDSEDLTNDEKVKIMKVLKK